MKKKKKECKEFMKDRTELYVCEFWQNCTHL